MKRKSGEGGGPVMKVQEVGYFFSSYRKSKASVRRQRGGQKGRVSGRQESDASAFGGPFPDPPEQTALSFLRAPRLLSPWLGQNDSMTRPCDVPSLSASRAQLMQRPFI